MGQVIDRSGRIESHVAHTLRGTRVRGIDSVIRGSAQRGQARMHINNARRAAVQDRCSKRTMHRGLVVSIGAQVKIHEDQVRGDDEKEGRSDGADVLRGRRTEIFDACDGITAHVATCRTSHWHRANVSAIAWPDRSWVRIQEHMRLA